MVDIHVNQNINHEAAVRQAIGKLKKSSEEIVREMRKREFHIKPSVKKRMKSEAARKALRKHQRKMEVRNGGE
jgi:ribosomal protein S21